MFRKIGIVAMVVLGCSVFASAAQRQMFKIVPTPALSGVIAAGDTVRVDWVQLTSAGSQFAEPEPAEARVYFARSPAGGDLSRYREVGQTLDANRLMPFGSAQKRRTEFVPNRQGGAMGPGTYYCVVAAVSGADTLFSDYFTIMVESSNAPSLVSPKANLVQGQSVVAINELTPVFRWNRVEGVPYYHVMLSDGPIVSLRGSSAVVSDSINIIWQAITPNTSIAYGAPDPSGTNTASPPPLTPGRNYAWMVLNNYGNHTSFTSDKFDAMELLTGQFVINGTPIDSPTVVSPSRNQVFNNTPSIDFRWTNIDTNAVSYLVNVFSFADGEDIGIDGLGDMDARVLIWEATVARGNAVRGQQLGVTLNAAATLTGGEYVWRVYAIDSRGAASTGRNSTSSFRYQANTGTVALTAMEVLGGVEAPVSRAEVRTEVVSGPAQAPLAFFTGNNGGTERSFPAGTYRFTVSKDGYSPQTVTVTVERNATTRIPVVLTRPEAALFGRVLAGADSSAVNMARVTAVSNWGDTISVFSGGNGGFRLNCRAGDWTVTAEKAGYRHTASRRVTLRIGDSREFGDIFMEKNPFALAGVVRNPAGASVIGARVRLFRDGAVIDELASTPQSGSYLFHVTPGRYTLTAEKAGYVMFSRGIDVTGPRTQDVTLREGATLVNGAVLGKRWGVASGGFLYAPVGAARVSFRDRDAPSDTFTVPTDPTFGRFSVNLPQGRDYDVLIEAAGFISSSAELLLSGESASTVAFADTLSAYASISGGVTSADGGAPLAGVNIFVNDANGRTAASAITSSSGAYEVRGIPPGGVYTVFAGMSGFFTRSSHVITINADGSPADSAAASYDFVMAAGNNTVSFSAVGYNGSGAVNIIFPLNHTLDFAAGSSAALNGAGPGVYVFEAIAASNPNLLQLSRGTVSVPESEEGSVAEAQIYFPIEHSSPDTLVKNEYGRYVLAVNRLGLPEGVSITSVELLHRSEGRARFASVVRSDFGPGEPYGVEFVPASDGVNMQYYFVVSLSNGVVYGSDKQIFSAYVKPDPRVITMLAVTPEASGDTLVVPSSYGARFALKAFYGDQFTAVDNVENIGAIDWLLVNENDQIVSRGSGGSFEFATPDSETFMALTVTVTPSGGYTVRGDRGRIDIPIRVTGSALRSVSVLRSGEDGPIVSGEEAGFIIEAVDRGGRLVSVTPQWSVTPALGAGTINADGAFRPNANFFGSVRIIAEAAGLSAEYPGGQEVRYALRHNANASDTANTLLGLRLAFPAGSVPAGETVEFSMAVPELNNHIHRGQDFRMADAAAYDVSASAVEKITGSVSIIIDVPPRLREAARKGDQEFRIARWFPDSLKWIPLESEVINNGAAVSAVLTNDNAPSLAKVADAPPISAVAARLAARARYALVTKTNKLTVNVNISPHPFSPFIRPVREYGPGAPEGTCIKVDVEAPESYVRSIKVHIHNATGMRVWAVEKQSAGTGENSFWWNGRIGGGGGSRSSVREEVWTDDYHQRTMNRPMARNGRYFVTVIVTDNDGGQKRVMRPLVLMK